MIWTYKNADPEFWANIPEHYDTSRGVLHDRRYDEIDARTSDQSENQED